LPITVIAQLAFREDAADEGIKALEDVLPDTRAFDGCLGVTLHREQGAPHKAVLIEQWDSSDAHKAYMSWRAETGSSSGMRAALSGAPAVQYLDDLRAF
jgi:quinol monooxygenase YgiN